MDLSWIEQLKGEFPNLRINSGGEAILAHSYDSWPVGAKWRQQEKRPYSPDAVLYPVSVGEVGRLLRWASERQVPVTPWGAGSGVTGAALSLEGGICLDLSLMNGIISLDETNLLVKVEAGVMGHVLEAELSKRGYTLNHSPQSIERSTVGGWVATRAIGQFSSRWGGIEDLVVALTVVLSTGEVVETCLVPRAAIGPDLQQLFIGSEGSLGVIAEVTLKIFPLAPCRRLETVVFDRVELGLTAMRRIMQAGLRPFLMRLYDQDESRYLLRRPDVIGNHLLLGFEGDEAVVAAEYQAALRYCAQADGKVIGPDVALGWMGRRFDFSTIESVLDRPGGIAETIEIAHFWGEILETYQDLKAGLAPLAAETLGHFSHVYTQGTCLYLILLGQAEDAAAAEKRLIEIWDVAMRTCLKHGAAISHHHGIGLARLPYIRQALGSSHSVLGRLKRALDPAGILNPGKFELGAAAETADRLLGR